MITVQSLEQSTGWQAVPKMKSLSVWANRGSTLAFRPLLWRHYLAASLDQVIFLLLISFRPFRRRYRDRRYSERLNARHWSRVTPRCQSRKHSLGIVGVCMSDCDSKCKWVDDPASLFWYGEMPCPTVQRNSNNGCDGWSARLVLRRRHSALKADDRKSTNQIYLELLNSERKHNRKKALTDSLLTRYRH